MGTFWSTRHSGESTWDPSRSPGGGAASRYECKYLIGERRLPELREFIRPFVRPDEHALGRPDSRYPICSLYLDSRGLALYRQTREGNKNRFKLRIRSYADREEDPVWLEIKRRVNGVILKRRARVGRAAVRRWLRDGCSGPSPPGGLPAAEFARLSRDIGALPRVRVRYQREAYQSAGGDPVRLTFDTEVAYSPSPGAALEYGSGIWADTPVGDVILEVKFTDHFPNWIHSLIEAFELDRRSVPKYCLSVGDLLRRSGARSALGF